MLSRQKTIYRHDKSLCYRQDYLLLIVDPVADLLYTVIIINKTDNGKGINDSDRDKIFEPKFTTKSSGMGLGLPMVKNIVEAYDGTITFITEPNKGTVFTIILPKK